MKVLFWIGLLVGTMGSSLSFAEGCKFFRDPLKIVHWTAGNTDSLYHCFGYFHAKDRGNQMILFKRIALGMSAETVGASGIKRDFLFRLLNLRELSERLYSEVSDSTRQILVSYAEGVNQGFSESPEMSDEAWTPQDSILLVLLQSFDQSRKPFEKRIQAEQVQSFRESMPGLKNVDLPWEEPILDGQPPKDAHPNVRSVSMSLPETENLGSNNWVVSAKRSGTGTAWFSNDPHLGLKTPSYWYWVQFALETSAQQWVGASFPGIPSIPAGANLDMAWGLTNAYLDFSEVVDVARSEIQGDIDSEYPLIWFKWGFLKLPFFFKKSERIPGGYPVLPIDSRKGYARILNWSGFRYTGKSIDSLLQFHSSKSVEEMDRVLKKVQISGWNFVFASRTGEIGYRTIGLAYALMPKEKRQDPVPILTRAELEARKMLLPEEMPSVLRPAKGYVVTANQRHWKDFKGIQEGYGYASGFRGWKLNQMISKTRKLDRVAHQKIQCDTQAVDALFLMPRLLESLPELWRRYPAEAKLFQEWKDQREYETDEQCSVCALYRRWMNRFQEKSTLNESALYGFLSESVLSEEISRLLVSSFELARSDLGSGGLPVWGTVHRLFLRHQSGLENLDPGGSVGTAGDDFSVNPGTATWSEKEKVFEQTSGASQRIVIEMASIPKVYRIYPGEQSEKTKIDWSDTNGPIQKWKRCELEPIEFPIEFSKNPDLNEVVFQKPSTRSE